jgi:hypothetical protein
MLDDDPSDDSIDATTFQGINPDGSPCLLEMIVMGFGLCNAPPTFTLLITHISNPFIHKLVIVYLDEICIYSKSPEKHLDHIRQVLMALRKNRIIIKIVKCFWAKRETEYLGFIDGKGIVRTSPSKVVTTKDWSFLETQKQIKSVLFFSSFYR